MNTAFLLLKPDAELFAEGVAALRRATFNGTHGWDRVGRPSAVVPRDDHAWRVAERRPLEMTRLDSWSFVCAETDQGFFVSATPTRVMARHATRRAPARPARLRPPPTRLRSPPTCRAQLCDADMPHAVRVAVAQYYMFRVRHRRGADLRLGCCTRSQMAAAAPDSLRSSVRTLAGLNRPAGAAAPLTSGAGASYPRQYDAYLRHYAGGLKPELALHEKVACDRHRSVERSWRAPASWVGVLQTNSTGGRVAIEPAALLKKTVRSGEPAERHVWEVARTVSYGQRAALEMRALRRDVGASTAGSEEARALLRRLQLPQCERTLRAAEVCLGASMARWAVRVGPKLRRDWSAFTGRSVGENMTVAELVRAYTQGHVDNMILRQRAPSVLVRPPAGLRLRSCRLGTAQ